MTVAAYVESAYSSLRRLSRLGAETVSQQPDLRESMSRQLVDALRRQLVATNNLRATCENHLSQINDIKDTASQVILWLFVPYILYVILDWYGLWFRFFHS